MKKITFKRIQIGRKLKNILILISFIFLISNIILIFYNDKYQKYVDKKYNVLSYNNSSSIDYSVSLFPNILYNQNTIGSGQIYIADYIDCIKTNLRYDFKGEKDVKLNVKYKASALIEGYIQDTDSEKGMKTLWKKEFVLLPQTYFYGEGKKLYFIKEIPINYSYYNNYALEIIKSTGIGCNVKMTVLWYIDVEGISKEGKFKETLLPNIQIPLNVKYFEIKGNLKDDKNGAITKTQREISSFYYKKTIFFSLGILLSIIFSIILILSVPVNSLDNTYKYINRIFKHHGYRIVNIKESIDLKDKYIIKVKSFNDLVKISDYLSKTILYKDDFKNKKCYTFYIIDGSIVYVYDMENTYIIKKNSTKIAKTY